jgi:hypothetical protein
MTASYFIVTESSYSEPFSSLSSGLKLALVQDVDRFGELAGLVWAAAQFPQHTPAFELGEGPLAPAAA